MPRDKSAGWALLLTVLLGPLGLLYATVVGALLLLLVSVVLSAYTSLRYAPEITWLISVVWGPIVATMKHRRYESWRTEQDSQLPPDPRP